MIIAKSLALKVVQDVSYGDPLSLMHKLFRIQSEHLSLYLRFARLIKHRLYRGATPSMIKSQDSATLMVALNAKKL